MVISWQMIWNHWWFETTDCTHTFMPGGQWWIIFQSVGSYFARSWAHRKAEFFWQGHTKSSVMFPILRPWKCWPSLGPWMPHSVLLHTVTSMGNNWLTCRASATPPQSSSLFFLSSVNGFDLFPFKHCSCLVAESCLTLCNPMDCSLPGSSVHGISQARILEWVAISFSRGSSWSRGQTHFSCWAGRFFADEPLGKSLNTVEHLILFLGTSTLIISKLIVLVPLFKLDFRETWYPCLVGKFKGMRAGTDIKGYKSLMLHGAFKSPCSVITPVNTDNL